jgi:hypothetical protein
VLVTCLHRRRHKTGDRKLNHALYMMAIVQVPGPSAGQAYYQRKLAEGKSPKEALRCLKRRLRMPSTGACWPISTSGGPWSGNPDSGRPSPVWGLQFWR